MALLDPTSSYQKWTLTPQELAQGSILSITQKQCIQNQIAQAAERRLSLNLDPNNVIQFAQEEAEIKGTIQALQYLMTLSDAMEQEILNPTPQEN